MLEVIKDQKHFSAAKIVNQLHSRHIQVVETEIETAGNCNYNRISGICCCQRHKACTMSEGSIVFMSNLHRQSCFADPACTGQSQQLTIGIGKPFGDLC